MKHKGKAEELPYARYCFYSVTNILFKLYNLSSTSRIDTIVIILQIRILTLKEMELFIHDHTSSQSQSRTQLQVSQH